MKNGCLMEILKQGTLKKRQNLKFLAIRPDDHREFKRIMANLDLKVGYLFHEMIEVYKEVKGLKGN